MSVCDPGFDTGRLTGCNDTTDTTETDNEGTGDASLGGHADVVLTVGEAGRDVGLRAGDSEETAKVADADVGAVCRDGETNDTDDVRGGDKGRAHLDLIRPDSEDEGVDGSEDVWGSGEQEGELLRVTTAGENDRQEEGDCRSVADQRGARWYSHA
jgi:hypothetical protein